MTSLVALHHRTAYAYDRPVKLLPQLVRLRPAPHTRVPVTGYTLAAEPSGHVLRWQQDLFGNWLARLVMAEATTRFDVEVELVVDLVPVNPFDFIVADGVSHLPAAYPALLRRSLIPYLDCEGGGPRLDGFVASLETAGRPVVDFLVALNQRVQAEIAYRIRMEPGVQTPEETLALASGSCRDSAWLLVQVLRRIGLAARFVSGYLIELSIDSPGGEGGKDRAELHAWAEVYLPGAGWIGLDATSGLLTGEGHIPLAASPHYALAAPVSGRIGADGPVNTEFTVEMSVRRLGAAAGGSAQAQFQR